MGDPTSPAGEPGLPARGRVVGGRYRVISATGVPDLGVIARAEDEKTRRRVEVLLGRALGPGALPWPERLAQWARVEDPAILPILDGGEDDGLPFVVVPHVEAPSLAERLREDGAPMPPREVVSWMRPLADALDGLHARRLAHGHVMADTIRFDGKGSVRLLPLGVWEAGSPAGDCRGLALAALSALGAGDVALPDGPAPVPPALDAALRGATEGGSPSYARCADLVRAVTAAIGGADPAGGSRKSPAPKAEPDDLQSTRTYGPLVLPGDAPLLGRSAPSDAKPAETDLGGTLSLGTAQLPRGGKKRRRTWLYVGGAALLAVVGLAVVANLNARPKGPVQQAALAAPRLTSPPNDHVTREAEVLVRGAVDEKVVRQVLVDGEPVAVTDGGFLRRLTLSEEGTREVVVVAKDATGRTAEVRRRVTYDRTAPRLSLEGFPAEEVRTTNRATETLRGRVDDPQARLQWRPAPAGAGDEPVSWRDVPAAAGDGTFSLPIDLPQEGESAYELRAVDRAENLSQVTVRYLVDRTLPSLVVEEPGNGSVIDAAGGRLEVRGRMGDPSARLTVGDTEVTPEADGRFSLVVPVAATVREGEAVVIRARAVDPAGNETPVEVRATRGPFLRITAPRPDVVTREQPMRVEGVLGEPGLRVEVGESSVAADADGRFALEVTLPGEGLFDLPLKVVDSTGRAHEKRIQGIYDVTPPVLKLLQVNGSSQWSTPGYRLVTSEGSPMVLAGEIEDASPCVVSVGPDSVRVASGRWEIRTAAQSGADRVQVVARDAAGNEAEPVGFDTFVSRAAFPGLTDAGRSPQGWPMYRLEKDPTVELVFVPGGVLAMGAVPDDPDAAPDESPRRDVEVPAFLVMTKEVTWGQVQRFVDQTGHALADDRAPPEDSPDLPATGLRLADIQAYLRWAGLTLPSEAQWERAARGGLSGARYPFGDGTAWDAAKARVGTEGPAPVGTSGPPNPFGLYDVAGNAAEWCLDGYARYSARASGEPAPVAGRTAKRVVRGGSWKSTPAAARLSARRAESPDSGKAVEDVGFRAVYQVVR